MQTFLKLAGGLGVAMIFVGLGGCSGGDNNRTVTKEEISNADANRQDYIDKLNIPESQKAAMKAHMGGPPVADPAAAAKAGATAPTGRRR
ncbi:hypothetical protein BH11ARM2_BH11ARM2_13910 [soil metagenome]